MTHTYAARKSREHAAEHDEGICDLGCTTTADDFREEADRMEQAAIRRFAALDGEARQAFVRAAFTLATAQQLQPREGEDHALMYARLCGQLTHALGELLDLVGLAPEE